jgi:hypothetical protein
MSIQEGLAGPFSLFAMSVICISLTGQIEGRAN